MKPATPLRVLGEGCMKPVTPLRAENSLNLAVLCEQRCQRFQMCAARSSQRCRRFHLVTVIHEHWCHQFQARWSAGVVRWLLPHRREKVRPAGVDSGPNRETIRPAGEKRPILRCFVCAGRTFSRVGADGGEQGEFCRACGVWIGLGERKTAPAGGAVGFCEIFFAPACVKVSFFASFE